jgi:hypothetical protein
VSTFVPFNFEKEWGNECLIEVSVLDLLYSVLMIPTFAMRFMMCAAHRMRQGFPKNLGTNFVRLFAAESQFVALSMQMPSSWSN